MNVQPPPPSAFFALRSLPPLFLTLFACTATVGCGHTNGQTHLGGPHGQLANEQQAVHSGDTQPAGRHRFGDYDDDDGYYDVRASDNDTDDEEEKPADGDGDSDGGTGRYDGDDSSVRYFGHAAGPTDRQAIAMLTMTYYAAAAADDGAEACALIFSPIAKSYPRSLGVGGPPYLRGSKTCAEIAARLFDQNRTQVRADAASLRVTDVRVAGNLGLAVLVFKGRPVRQMETQRENGAWKMLAPLDTEMP